MVVAVIASGLYLASGSIDPRVCLWCSCNACLNVSMYFV